MRRLFLPMLLMLLAGAALLSVPPARGATCRSIPGLEPLLRPGGILLLGELHGTAEAPAFVEDVLCHAQAAGLKLLVGLEQPAGGQRGVDRYLASDGGPAARSTLLAGPFWSASYQDGRASVAIVGLLERIRLMRGGGARVQPVLFDVNTRKSPQERERTMATNLARAAAGAPDALLVVLTGNRHSRVTRGVPRQPEFEPMGSLLLGKLTSPERVVALDMAHGGGDAWVCTPGCGVLELNGRQGESPWSIEMDGSTRGSAHAGWYRVGRITASLPARMSPDERALLTSPDVDSVVSASPTSQPSPARSTTPDSSSQELAAGPLTPAEKRVQGEWQAYDYGTSSRTYKISFDQRQFHAEGSGSDWYKGWVVIRPDREPAELDFVIEDCACQYKGMVSKAIFRWEGESLVMAAPAPGAARPTRFDKSSELMMELRRREVSLPPGTGPPARNHPAMVFDAHRGRGVLFGGAGESGALSDTWEWDGRAWHRHEGGEAPPARRSHALAYDEARRVTLLFGGYTSGGRLGDTWTWDGKTWRQVSTTGPSARSAHSLAYDASRKRVVLFGGSGDDGLLDDTWEWDGERWARIEAKGPPARRNHALAFDRERVRIILFGGGGSHGQFADTWSFDGGQWTRLSHEGPSARDHHALAYSSQLGGVLAFGGWAGAVLGDLWLLGGQGWELVEGRGPGRAGRPALIEMGSDGPILQFGGTDDTGLVGDLSAYSGGAWSTTMRGPLPQAAR